MAYLPDWEGKVKKRALLRPDFWDDHAHELALYARGQLKDVTRPVAHYAKSRRKSRGRRGTVKTAPKHGGP